MVVPGTATVAPGAAVALPGAAASALPGGVLGDVHRGITHQAMGSVVAERVVGQAVQVAFAGLVVLVAAFAGLAHRLMAMTRTPRK